MEERIVLADERLLNGGARATYAAHRLDGEWFFGASGFVDQPKDRINRVPVVRLIQADPSLADVCDLKPGWHAFRATADQSWSSGEIPSGRTYLMRYEARPVGPDHDGEAIGGAFINCWVISDAVANARERARSDLEQSGWAIISTLEEQGIEAGDVPEESQAYYRQAAIDGEVYVFHTFPAEEADA